jgi:hypothetical protein
MAKVLPAQSLGVVTNNVTPDTGRSAAPVNLRATMWVSSCVR